MIKFEQFDCLNCFWPWNTFFELAKIIYKIQYEKYFFLQIIATQMGQFHSKKNFCFFFLKWPWELYKCKNFTVKKIVGKKVDFQIFKFWHRILRIIIEIMCCFLIINFIINNYYNVIKWIFNLADNVLTMRKLYSSIKASCCRFTLWFLIWMMCDSYV